MTRWSMPLALAVLMALTGAGAAGEKIVTRLSTETKDGAASSDVSFADASCEEECHVATLSCTGAGGVEFIYADVDAKDAAKAITLEEKQIVLKAGGKTFDYFVYEMSFAEMTGSWWLTARAQSSEPGALQAALAKAKTFEAKIATRSITLPADNNVKAWAQACK